MAVKCMSDGLGTATRTANSKQWYEEPLHTLPHNNVQKLNICNLAIH